LNNDLNLVVGPEAIAGYQRLPYKHWYALAEFIDNSTQSYFDNKEVLDKAFIEEKEPLTITIVTEPKQKLIRISDNSIGMTLSELQTALTIGRPKKKPGRSKYGYGMKTAAGWFGNKWKITTKKLGQQKAAVYELNMNKFINSEPGSQNSSEIASSEDRHFTTIEITECRRSLSESTIRSIKEHLASMYRRDISEGKLRLVINEEEISFPGYQDEQWMKRVDGSSYRAEFNLKIANREVKGWVGVLGEGFGGRGKGGFAILQNSRCILSEESMWKPSLIYGKEGTTIPQRLVGEIELDGFEVNTQKDDIDWFGTEEEDLAKAIKDFCDERDFIKVARERFDVLKDQGLIAEREQGLDAMRAMTDTDGFIDALQIFEVPDPIVKPIITQPLIDQASQIEDAISIYLPALQKTFHVKYIKAGINDPYYTYEVLEDLSLLVIINENHPCTTSFAPNNAHFVHLRHCLFDAIAQWQCRLKTEEINADSVFMIKDKFLRINPVGDSN
jgi:hypothetical protein